MLTFRILRNLLFTLFILNLVYSKNTEPGSLNNLPENKNDYMEQIVFSKRNLDQQVNFNQIKFKIKNSSFIVFDSNINVKLNIYNSDDLDTKLNKLSNYLVNYCYQNEAKETIKFDEYKKANDECYSKIRLVDLSENDFIKFPYVILNNYFNNLRELNLSHNQIKNIVYEDFATLLGKSSLER